MKPLAYILFVVLTCVSLCAQESMSYGIDPKRDSAAFARYRSHLDEIRQERPTVALVLSGGGAKGAAHISVIKHLEREGIPIDLVLGTSIGGLVGGLYACGYDGEQLEAIIKSLDWDKLLYDSNPRRYDALSQKDYDRQFLLSIPFGKYKWDFLRPVTSRRSVLRDGIVYGRNIEDLLASLLVGYGDETDFLALPIPFACIASDMISAKPKVWHSGNLVEALRSTMSIPGLFTPVRRDGMVLMDGSMRSNYPAEIAKQLGADIIIGVDISTPSLDASQMQSMIDIVYQANDVLGRESYNAGLAVTDIYIQPNVNDFTLLSFDKESIDIILQRGKEAVEAAAADIDKLKVRLGTPNIRHSHNPLIHKASNLYRNSVEVDSIVFQGINDKEQRYLRRMLHLDSKGKRVVHIIQLEEDISTVMGTKAFEKITYQLLGTEEPYTLQFNCFRAPINQLGASVRFDTRDFASILFHYGINTHHLTGSHLDLKVRLGFDTRIGAEYTFSSGRGLDMGTALTFQAVQNGNFKSNNYLFDFKYNISRADAHISFLPWKEMCLRLGFRLDYVYINSILADINLHADDMEKVNKSNIFPYPYLLLRHESFDDPNFPTTGMMHKISYNLYMRGLQHDSPQTHALQLGFCMAQSFGRLTLMPHLDARYVTNSIFPYTNMLTVSEANRTLEQQITFVGISTPYSTMSLLGSARLDARLRLAKKHYITASAQLLHEAEEIGKIFDDESSQSHFGAALEYAYKSVVGPVRFNVHWSDYSKSVGFYLGIGLEF